MELPHASDYRASRPEVLAHLRTLGAATPAWQAILRTLAAADNSFPKRELVCGLREVHPKVCKYRQWALA